jgi:hypothetical protein
MFRSKLHEQARKREPHVVVVSELFLTKLLKFDEPRYFRLGIVGIAVQDRGEICIPFALAMKSGYRPAQDLPETGG